MPDAEVWVRALLAVAAVSVLSLSGAIILMGRANLVRRSLIFLIAFAAGALLGDAFLHILPEVAESSSGFDLGTSIGVLSGVVAFFILEKILHWHHAHIPHEEVFHPVAVTNLVGDGLHNFIDGAIVAGAFISSTKLGIATAVAVALHEIPQELGDFGILVHAGLKPKRALALNFMSALAAVAGAIFVLMTAGVGSIEDLLLPFTAGAFVYIASTDLIPELHKEPKLKQSFVQLAGLLLGLGIMLALLGLE